MLLILGKIIITIIVLASLTVFFSGEFKEEGE
jgi:hypothetical protein